MTTGLSELSSISSGSVDSSIFRMKFVPILPTAVSLISSTVRCNLPYMSVIIIKKLINDIDKPNNIKILDVGSGTGVLIPYLIDKFNSRTKITAVDFAKNMIAISKEKHKKYENIEYVVGDIYSLQFPSDTYDLIFCYSVFPPLTEKISILEKFRSWLKENGIVVIFHSQSREAINNLHKTAGAEVERDNLPSGLEIANLAENLDYEVIQIIDNDELYVVKISK